MDQLCMNPPKIIKESIRNEGVNPGRGTERMQILLHKFSALLSAMRRRNDKVSVYHSLSDTKKIKKSFSIDIPSHTRVHILVHLFFIHAHPSAVSSPYCTQCTVQCTRVLFCFLKNFTRPLPPIFLISSSVVYFPIPFYLFLLLSTFYCTFLSLGKHLLTSIFLHLLLFA